jgi:hypothetical protein
MDQPWPNKPRNTSFVYLRRHPRKIEGYRILIETNSIEEIEILGKEIQTKCGGELDSYP